MFQKPFSGFPSFFRVSFLKPKSHLNLSLLLYSLANLLLFLAFLFFYFLFLFLMNILTSFDRYTSQLKPGRSKFYAFLLYLLHTMSLDFQVLLCYHFSQLGMLKYSWKAELVFFFPWILSQVMMLWSLWLFLDSVFRALWCAFDSNLQVI